MRRASIRWCWGTATSRRGGENRGRRDRLDGGRPRSSRGRLSIRYHFLVGCSGRHNVCSKIRFLSTGGNPGFFREFVNLPEANLLGIPQRLSLEAATRALTAGCQLASFPVDMLAAVFGRNGERLVKIAKGLDTSAVFVSKESPRISVSKIMERDEIDPGRLESALFQQVEEAGWDLRRLNRRPGRLRLEIRYADGLSVDTQKRLPSWSIQADRSLFQLVLPAFHQIFRRRVAVRGVLIEFSELAMPSAQLPLFTWKNQKGSEERDLQEALDTIRLKFGKKIIAWARAV